MRVGELIYFNPFFFFFCPSKAGLFAFGLLLLARHCTEVVHVKLTNKAAERVADRSRGEGEREIPP